MADSKIKMAPAGRKLAIVCGVEQATLLLDKFGPGGTSRCIQHPMVKNHLLNPIEFTALGGKSSSWKIAIKSGDKALQHFFDNSILVNCARKCVCPKCETARQNPTDFDTVSRWVYGSDSPEKLVKPSAKSANEVGDEGGNGIAADDLVEDEFCSSPDPSPNKQKTRKGSGGLPADILERVPSKSATKSIQNTQPPPIENSPARKKIAAGKSLAASTPDGKRKQRDIRSFFTPPTGAAGVGASESTPSNADQDTSSGETETEKKKTPVKLRFESGEVSRIISTDEVLKKDLAHIKVVSSSCSPPPSIKDEFDKSMEIKTEPTSIKAEPITSATTTPTKGDPAWNAAVNERYAAMLGTSIAELMEKKKRQSAMAAASEQGSRKRKGKRTSGEEAGNSEENKKQKLIAEEATNIKAPKQGRRIKTEPVERAEESEYKSMRPKRETPATGSRLEAAKLKNAGVTVSPEKKMLDTKMSPAPEKKSPRLTNLSKKEEVTNSSASNFEPLKTPVPRFAASASPAAATSSPASPGASAMNGGDSMIKSQARPTRPLAVVSTKFLPSPTIKNNGPQKTVNGKPSIPAILTNGHGPPPSPCGSPNVRTPRKIRKEEFVLIPPSGFKVKQEPKESKQEPEERAPPKLPPYNVMIKNALTELNSVGGEGCTKLELLLFILRSYQPKEGVAHVTNKLIQSLDQGIKKGLLLSSASCTPRKRKIEPSPTPPQSNKPAAPKPTANKPPSTASPSPAFVKQTAGAAGGKGENKVGNKKAVMKAAAVLAHKLKTESPPTQARKKIGVTPKKLLEPLATICKAKRMSRVDALRKVWVYIHQKKLLDPNDRTRIICDEKLRKLTKSKAIGSKALLGFVKNFMEPL